MKTDYEIEGCWSGLKIQSHCRACGTLMVSVPQENHFNSQYWRLQKHDKEQLICCPKNCPVTLAEKKIKDYLAIRHYCTGKSATWKWELDYKSFKNAWIDRTGKVFPMEIREHVNFACNMDTSEQELEDKGWLKLSMMDLMWQRKLSKRQIDFVFDYLVSNGCEEQTSEFMYESKSPTGFYRVRI